MKDLGQPALIWPKTHTRARMHTREVHLLQFVHCIENISPRLPQESFAREKRDQTSGVLWPTMPLASQGCSSRFCRPFGFPSALPGQVNSAVPCWTLPVGGKFPIPLPVTSG